MQHTAQALRNVSDTLDSCQEVVNGLTAFSLFLQHLIFRKAWQLDDVTTGWKTPQVSRECHRSSSHGHIVRFLVLFSRTSRRCKLFSAIAGTSQTQCARAA